MNTTSSCYYFTGGLENKAISVQVSIVCFVCLISKVKVVFRNKHDNEISIKIKEDMRKS